MADNRQVDLNDFHLFQLIAQHGSLSGAAQHADLTVAAVSARLKRIERELQVRLIDRTTRSACGDGAMVRAWAVAGAGIAYKARIDVEPDIREGRLTRLLPECTGEPVPITAVMPSRRYVPTRVRSMLKYLSERYATI